MPVVTPTRAGAARPGAASGGPAHPFVPGRGQRPLPLRPHRRGGLYRDGVQQSQSGHAVSKAGVVAMPSIGQHRARRPAILDSSADLRQRDLRLGLKDDLVGHTRFLPPFGVLGSVLWQVQLKGQWQAGRGVGHREAHGDLAVGLFAELAALLMGDAGRGLAFFGKPVSSTIQAVTPPRRRKRGEPPHEPRPGPRCRSRWRRLPSEEAPGASDGHCRGLAGCP